MSDLHYRIQEMIEENIFSYWEIARIMRVPLEWVYAVGKGMYEARGTC